jgi:hypothetical protein
MTFFGATVNQIAVETGFVQRRPRKGLDGLVFLRTLVFGFLEHPRASLTHLVEVCLDQGVEITNQGLDQRINARSVAFLKVLFTKAIRHFQTQVPLPLAVLQHFTAVNLVDSSVQSLPASLADDYPGAGGCASPASLKVQLVLEFLKGNFSYVAVTPGRDPDQGHTGYLAVVPPGSLTIWDLGYFSLEAIKTIINRQAYWLSRYLPGTGILTAAREPLDLVQYLRTHPAEQQELAIRLGARKQHQLACRLVLLRVPDAVAEERRRKAQAKAKRQGRTPAQETLFLYNWTIFVTNIPAAWVSLSQIATLYRIRWQVELCFKLFKSYCGLDNIGDLRRERVLTCIYAQLIAAVLVNYILAPLRVPDDAFSGRELSVFQVSLVLRRQAAALNAALDDLASSVEVIATVCRHLLHCGFKDKRKGRPNALQLLADLATATTDPESLSVATTPSLPALA